MFIILAMLAALLTIIDTRSCGLLTMIMPSRGTDWKSVSGTSPVPGGQSTMSRSVSFQIVSVQNCLTVPAMSEPLHTTGLFSSSSMRLTDMTSIPVFVLGGIMPCSSPVTSPFRPKAFGTDGPVTSASSIPT